MANVRPPRAKQYAKASVFEEPQEVPPVEEETTQGSFFFSDYNRMHPKLNADPPQAKGPRGTAIKGPSGCTLETLVATLANLQFTTKGKVGEDGKFEIVFCSPEPIVSEVKPRTPSPVRQKVEQVPVPVPRIQPEYGVRFAEPEQGQVRYVRVEPRSGRHRRSRRSALEWLATS